MYKVVGSAKSRTIRVLWLLQEMSIEYEHIDVGARSEQALALSPNGKIPALIEGDHTYTDSMAILTYLADKHAQFTYPAGTPERARQDGHTHFLLDEFDACLWMAARHSFVLPEDQRVAAIKDSLKWEFARSCERLTERLGTGPFLMGDTMTIADILAAHCGRWARNAGFEIGPPALNDYLDRLLARPAFRRVTGET